MLSTIQKILIIASLWLLMVDANLDPQPLIPEDASIDIEARASLPGPPITLRQATRQSILRQRTKKPSRVTLAARARISDGSYPVCPDAGAKTNGLLAEYLNTAPTNVGTGTGTYSIVSLATETRLRPRSIIRPPVPMV